MAEETSVKSAMAAGAPAGKPVSTAPAPPRALLETIVTSTPVALTVLATILAGLSSSEMTPAQYFREVAAQHQAKTGDQWAFYQAKRIRAEGCRNTAELLGSMADAPSVDRAAMFGTAQRVRQGRFELGLAPSGLGLIWYPPEDPGPIEERLSASDIAAAFGVAEGGLPSLPAEAPHPSIDAAVAAVAARASDGDMAPLLKKVREPELQKAVDAAEQNAVKFEAAMKPAGKAMDELHALTAAQADDLVEAARRATGAAAPRIAALAADARALSRAAAVVGLRFTAARYDRDAAYNLSIANLREVQVRMAGADSDRHRVRSTWFFIGMLAAQAGVTIATISLSLKRRSLLLGLASAAGLAAVTLGAYVYLMM